MGIISWGDVKYSINIEISTSSERLLSWLTKNKPTLLIPGVKEMKTGNQSISSSKSFLVIPRV